MNTEPKETNDPKLSDRRSWRALCAVGAALLVGMEAQGMTAEPVRCSALLGPFDEVVKFANCTGEFFSAGSGGVSGQKVWRQSTDRLVEAVELIPNLRINVASDSGGFLSEGAGTEKTVRGVVSVTNLVGGGDLGQLLALDEKALKRAKPVLAGNSGGFGSGLALAGQGGSVNDDPADDDNNRSPYSGGERRFWLAYWNVMPLTLLGLGICSWLCYRHGRWVGIQVGHDRAWNGWKGPNNGTQRQAGSAHE